MTNPTALTRHAVAELLVAHADELDAGIVPPEWTTLRLRNLARDLRLRGLR
jgi:hypothetical protein